jgi:RimJ/RimL family protein N-acetyltransferase
VAGQGIAPRAVEQLAKWAFSQTDLHRLEIVAALGNTRSQRVAEKAGAIREGILRGRLWLHSTPHDAVLYSITRTPSFAPA